MQAVKVSCLARTFALAKISNSRERKPRSRKTREERKAMVESFVKKYQNSNNGSFPSLNLTHKEVGGSFYTVREIVRELIQENRVLGPGSPTSKVLKLESGSEDDEVDPFSMDLPSDMSTSMIGHAIKQKQLLEENHASTEINVDIPKSEPQEIFSSHNEISFSEDKGNDTSNHVEENSFTDTHLSAIVADDIADPVKPSVETQDILKNFEYLEAEQPAPSVSAMSSLGAFLVNGNNLTSNLAKASDTSLENDVPIITGKDSLPENNIPEDSLPESKVATSSSIGSISDKLLDPTVSFAVEVFPIPSSAKANNPNKRFMEMECAKEEEVLLVDVKDPVINGSGSTENQPINKEAPAIQMSPESGVFEPLASRTTKIELESLVTDNPSFSGEPVSAQVTDTPQVQFQSSYTSYSRRKSQEKDIRDSKPSEINPFWSAIRAFVTAVFKVWS
ncbi:hypothetical protein DsansV1_C04g0047291 [Dioscorea sansibarensis]